MDIRKNLNCQHCGRAFDADLMADSPKCSHCGAPLSRIEQVTELLDMWYYPRRWQRAIDRPSVAFLVERLWSQQFDPRKLYEGLAPSRTNFEVFCHTVTQVVMQGIRQGWVKLHLPDDPLADDPMYRLEFLDQERFADEMERALPDVSWEGQIEVETGVPGKEEAKDRVKASPERKQ